ncbi:type II toxin-antitoxin system RelE/ParE family toxin [Thiomicrorhabdus aquaedulcis]|uniref:type II toxin-antitoxin system RelE/ParE family toxin n=1 Tax=Thiomicrorhabdus aquaedulcis TaxID=2211106 RepID=UPI000FD77770|nr:type II toxin-antitoxin system RelE/ParE family toxin [Thiomicrorhabdus aquaedulcis]
MSYILNKQAENDLVALYIQGYQQFGEQQAEHYFQSLESTFELLAQFPTIARIRTELTNDVRVHSHGTHLILYRIANNSIEILRIRHAKEDWLNNE